MRALFWIVTAGCVMAGCAAHAAIPMAPGVHVWQSPTDGSITEGETTLDVDADTAYAVASDYPSWSKLFPDIVAVEVTKRDGVDARVTLVHKDGNRDNVHFHNKPSARVLWFEDTGGSAEVWAEIEFAPGSLPGTTHVHSRLFADVHGLASLVVTSGRLRSLRQKRITSDLSQLHQYFSAERSSR